MAQQSITFPPEIHDIIIGSLAQEGDMNALKAVARTCKALLPTCRSHIFATLRLVIDLSSDVTANTLSRQLENLRCVFKSNPSLAFYVRELHYMIQLVDDKYQSFHSVLKTLTRVKVLVLRGTIHDAGTYRLAGTVDWPNLSASLHTALNVVLHSPCLTELYLDHIINFPIKILAGCSNLTQLTIDSADFQDVAAPDDMSFVDVLHLNSLTFMDYSSRAIQTLMDAKDVNNSKPIIDFAQLTVLNSLDKTADTVVTALLDLSKRLESMTCTVWDSFNQPFRDVLKPHTLHTLKAFSAVILIPPWLGDIDLDPLYSLPDEFDKWAANNILERIDIKIDVSQDARLPTGATVWERLNALAICHHFPNLRVVSLMINLWKEATWSQDIKAKLEGQQHEIFRELLESDKVTFQLSVDIISVELM